MTQQQKQQPSDNVADARLIVARNATEDVYQQIRLDRIGTTFQQKGIKYCVTDVLLDDLKRVILIGQPKKKGKKGGPGLGQGRKPGMRRHLELDPKDAKTLFLLTKHRRALFNNPALTEEEVVASLVEAEWSEMDQEYQRNAEIAGEPYII